MSIIYRHRCAGYPALAVETAEDTRFVRELVECSKEDALIWRCAAAPLPDKTGKPAWILDCRTSTAIVQAGGPPWGGYPEAYRRAADSETPVILIVQDWQHICRQPGAYRPLLEALSTLKAKGATVVLLAPAWKLPAELEHEVPVLQHALPSRAQLDAALQFVGIESSAPVSEADAPRVLDAAAGLTLAEAENSMALAFAEAQTISPDIIRREKMRLVKQSGFLECWEELPVDSIGGLAGLREYISGEVLPVKADPQLAVRGILLTGIPGTGKSLSARVAGSLLGWPVLRMDVAGLRGSLVGQSEANLRGALKVAEAVAPCILVLDEVEKGIGGYASSAQTDGGVTLGMVGYLLTWLQEHRSPILVIATSNDHKKLPPEFTRAGRFDETFFLDLPGNVEREEIAAVHLKRYGCPAALAGAIGSLSKDWTGAEIEQLVKSAARRSQRQPTAALLEKCATEIRPISKIRESEIKELQRDCGATMRLANTPDKAAPTSGRKIRGTENN